jgi:hypothetical protein
MKIYYLIILIILQANLTFAQTDFKIKITCKLQEQDIHLDSIYKLDSTTSIKINTLKFYLGNIELNQRDKQQITSTNSYYLIDLNKQESTTISISLNESTTIETLQFCFGTDSLSNVSGAMDGDLDPTKGMYWAWNSGYINFKCEGEIIHTEKREEFTYHLGGYQAPFETVQSINLPLESNNKMNIEFNLFPFLLEQIRLNNYTIMSPGKTAQEGMKTLSQSF